MTEYYFMVPIKVEAESKERAEEILAGLRERWNNGFYR